MGENFIFICIEHLLQIKMFRLFVLAIASSPVSNYNVFTMFSFYTLCNLKETLIL